MESNHWIRGNTTQQMGKIGLSEHRCLWTQPPPHQQKQSLTTYSFGHKNLHNACVVDDAWFGE